MVQPQIDFNEMIEEIREDYRQIVQNIKQNICTISTSLQTQTKFPAQWGPHYYKSPNGKNVWVLNMLARSPELKVEDLTTFCIRESEQGNFLIKTHCNISDEAIYVHIYHPHLLERYREQLNLKLEGEKLYTHFLNKKHIKRFVGNPEKFEYDGREQVCVTTTEGVMLGETWNNNNIYQAFLSHEMFKKKNGQTDSTDE